MSGHKRQHCEECW